MFPSKHLGPGCLTSETLGMQQRGGVGFRGLETNQPSLTAYQETHWERAGPVRAWGTSHNLQRLPPSLQLSLAAKAAVRDHLPPPSPSSTSPSTCHWNGIFQQMSPLPHLLVIY